MSNGPWIKVDTMPATEEDKAQGIASWSVYRPAAELFWEALEQRDPLNSSQALDVRATGR